MIVERQIQVNVSLLLLIRYYNPNDTDDDDTDDSALICLGESWWNINAPTPLFLHRLSETVPAFPFSSITLQTSSIRLQMLLTRPCDISQKWEFPFFVITSFGLLKYVNRLFQAYI